MAAVAVVGGVVAATQAVLAPAVAVRGDDDEKLSTAQPDRESSEEIALCKCLERATGRND